MQTYTINIRPKRQTTFPQPLLQAVGLNVGDKLIAKIEKKRIILEPQKQAALNALRELQRLFRTCGVSEKEMQESLKKTREQLTKERYG